MADQLMPEANSLVYVPCFDEASISGIYFLYLEGVVVYVGRANNVRRRLGEHISEGVKKFDEMSWLPYPLAHLESVERKFISRLAPSYNTCSFARGARARGVAGAREGLLPADCRNDMGPKEAAAYLGLSVEAFCQMRKLGVAPVRRRLPRQRKYVYRSADLRDFAVEHPSLIIEAKRAQA